MNSRPIWTTASSLNPFSDDELEAEETNQSPQGELSSGLRAEMERTWASVSRSVTCGPTASASSGAFLEMQTLGSYPRPIEAIAAVSQDAQLVTWTLQSEIMVRVMSCT